MVTDHPTLRSLDGVSREQRGLGPCLLQIFNDGELQGREGDNSAHKLQRDKAEQELDNATLIPPHNRRAVSPCNS